MTTLYHAHTEQVNPSGATPVLTEAQLYKGFQRKIRRPWEFVPAIASAEVLDDKDGVVRRKVIFKTAAAGPGSAPAENVEICTEHPPSRVDYAIEGTGTTVLNIISHGPSGDPTDLYVTYAFEWTHPELTPGSPEAQKAEEEHKKVGWMAVKSSIATTRKLVSEGEIQ